MRQTLSDYPKKFHSKSTKYEENHDVPKRIQRQLSVPGLFSPIYLANKFRLYFVCLFFFGGERGV